MIKQGKMVGIGSHGMKSRISRLPIGLNGLNFSRWIASRYGIFYRSDSMPALIFRKFFDIKTASNSLPCIPGNNYLSLQKFNYFINTPLQKTLSSGSNSAISIQNICTFTKNLVPVEYYKPVSVPKDVYQHFYAESTEKNNSKTSSQNSFIQNDGYEKSTARTLRKADIQYTCVFTQPSMSKKDILSSVNPMMLAYLQRVFYFDTSTKIDAVTQSAYTHFISSVKLIDLDHLHYESIGTAVSDPDQITFTAEKAEEPLTIAGSPQGINTLSLRQIRTLKTSKNIASKQMGKEKEQFIQKLHQASIFSKRVLTLVNPVIRSYLHRDNTEALISKADSKRPAVRPGAILSKQDYDAAQAIKIHLLRQTGVLKHDENIASEQMEEEKKQSMPVFLHHPSFYTGNVLTLVSPLSLSYLQEALNFEFAGLRPGRKVVNAKKRNKASKNINSISRETEIQFFKKTERDARYENNARRNGEVKKQLIHVFHQLPSSKTELKHFSYEIKHRQVFHSHYNSGSFRSSGSASLVQLCKSYKRNVLTSEIQEVFSSPQRMLNFGTSRSTSAVAPAAIKVETKVETPLAKTRFFQGIKAFSTRRTRTLKDDKNIESEQIGKEKEQFMPMSLYRPSFYIRSFLTSLSPLALSYLQEEFNFEFPDLKPVRTVSSIKKANKEPKTISASTQDADALSYQQVRNIQILQYENVLEKDTDTGRGYLFPSSGNIKALKESINSPNNNFSPVPLINLEPFDHIFKKISSPNVDTNVMYNSGELVFKKPASQKNETVTENKGNVQTKNIFPTEAREDSGKELFKEKKIHEQEIGIIADRVYKIIEKRISIEKDRRGLF